MFTELQSIFHSFKWNKHLTRLHINSLLSYYSFYRISLKSKSDSVLLFKNVAVAIAAIIGNIIKKYYDYGVSLLWL